MKATNYVYDPNRPQLMCFDGETPRGGFIGEMATRQFMKLINEGIEVKIGNMKNEQSKRRKVQRLRAIWVSAGIDNHRSAILEGYGVSSTADLTHEQLDELIRNYSAQHNKPADDEIRRLRSAVIQALEKLGVYTGPDSWHRVNNYLMAPRICGKLMYNCNADELRVLIRKLYSILERRNKTIADEQRKSQLN